MKYVLIVLLIVAAAAAGGYYGIPFLIAQETAPLRMEISQLQQRLQKVEDFVKAEEEARKVTDLQPGADMPRVIQSVNTLAQRVAVVEGSLKTGLPPGDEALKGQRLKTDESLKEQAVAVDKGTKETQAKIQRIMFDATMAAIRGNILKARMDLLSKNIGTAKAELEVIEDALDKAKQGASEENRKIIGEMQEFVRKAKAEVDTSVPAAMNRIDLLWHEMSKLLKRS